MAQISELRIGDIVRIGCSSSRYHGVVGEIFDIQMSSTYAIVDMPSGTEARIEGIKDNVIMREMKRREKLMKKPIERWPKGDPQWFPADHLVVLKSE